MKSISGERVYAHINFSSEDIISASLMLEFHYLEMDEIETILDSIPLVEDTMK